MPTEDDTTVKSHKEKAPEDSRSDDGVMQKRQSPEKSYSITDRQELSLVNYDQDLDGPRIEELQDSLTEDQKEFIRVWHNTLAPHNPRFITSREVVDALATLTHSRYHSVRDYVTKTFPDTDKLQLPVQQCDSATSPDRRNTKSLHGEYNYDDANAHLPASALAFVQKYITSCHRSRPRNDGRRSVNTGPYRCTFGCGYRTKRVFDWRRHEETHEPQELWLCLFCAKEKSDNPFLVSRKDKFLRHARECHEDVPADQVLGRSKVDFVPLGDLECPRCGQGCDSWDERCRHVLGHFDEEDELPSAKGKALHDQTKASQHGSISEDSNEGERCEQAL